MYITTNLLCNCSLW